MRSATPTPTARTTPSSLELRGDIEGLFPGAVVQRRLSIENPHPFAIDVRTLTVTASSVPGCAASNVDVDPFAGRLTIAARRDAEVDLTVRMPPSAPDDCQGAVIPLVYQARAERTKRVLQELVDGGVGGGLGLRTP